MWLICIACHRSVKIKLPKSARLRCTSCGSTVAQTVRVLKQNMLNGGPTSADQAKVLTYAGLLSIAANRGYKVGWAAMKYRAIFGGQWPPEPKPEPANPGPALMWWIRKQNAEYAKTHFPRAKQEKLSLPEPASELMSADDWDVKL